MEARRRPLDEVRYTDQINNTIAKTTIEGKAKNTINNFRHRLRQLSRICSLMNPDDVKQAIGYSKLSNSSKCSYALAYEWFTKTNGLKWEKPHFKWNLPAPIMPTSDQVNKIISATTQKFATIFKLMAETGVEGEELHQTHRNQFDTTQAIISIKGLKGHGSANYKLKTQTAEMLRQYLARYCSISSEEPSFSNWQKNLKTESKPFLHRYFSQNVNQFDHALTEKKGRVMSKA